MFKLVSLTFALLVTFFAFGSLAHSEPKFSDFLAERIFISGAAAPLRWDEDVFPKQAMFRYVDDLDQKAERDYQQEADKISRRFAGHYVVLTTGCGTGLQCGVIIDLRSGQIASQLPLAENYYIWRPNSRLLIVNPYDEDADWVYSKVIEYYLWDNGEFTKIATEDWPAPFVSEPKMLVIPDNRPAPIPASRPTPTQLAKEKLIRKLSR